MTSTGSRRGLLTRWELLLGLLLLLLLLAWAVPVLERATWRTRRAEVGMILSSLQDAELSHRSRTGAWFTLQTTPQGIDRIGAHRAAWPATLPGGWTPPTRRARCSYRAEASGETLTLRATCDVDGDGQRARFEASPDGPIRRLTPEEVY